jgi:membrane associated rhomboid family serine protease
MGDTTTDTPDAVTVPLKRPPLWSTGLTLLATLTAVFCLSTTVDVAPRLWRGEDLGQEGLMSLGLAGFWITLVLTVLGKRLFVRMRPLPPIAFHDAYLILPRSPEARRTREVPYGEIMAVNEGGRAPKRHFFIESKRHVFHLPQEIFQDADGPDRLFSELRHRIVSLPQGAVLLEQTEQRRRAALRSMSHKPIVTQALLGIIVVFFLNAQLKGALDVPFGLLRWGANAPALVDAGEWYRLFAANFLHKHYLHTFMNGMALYYLGTLLERLLGWARYLAIYLLAGFVAMLASSQVASALMSVGASGAIFGLLGGFGVVSWRLKAQLPLGLRQTPRWWITMLGINAILPLLWPVVDVAAHVAGFATGALVTAIVLGRRRHLPAPAGRGLQGLAISLAAVYAGALGQAVYVASRLTPADEARLAQTVLHDPQVSPASLNALAWPWAYDNRATPPELEAARESAVEAVRRAPDVPDFATTLAQVEHRLGNFDAAIAAWRRALERLDGDEEAYVASQLARSLMARATAAGPQVPPGVAPDALRLWRRGDAWELTTTLASPPHGAVIFALVKRGAEPVALVQARIGASAHPPWTMSSDAVAAMPAGATAEVAYVAWDDAAAPGPTARWYVWPLQEPGD